MISIMLVHCNIVNTNVVVVKGNFYKMLTVNGLKFDIAASVQFLCKLSDKLRETRDFVNQECARVYGRTINGAGSCHSAIL